MLSYSRVTAQLSRIASQAHIKPSPKQFNFINLNSKYSNKSKNNKTGSTAKVEECVPKISRSTIPPLPPVPPPTPLQGSSPPLYPQVTKPVDQSRPICEDKTNSCPPNCPPKFEEDCHTPGSGPIDKGPEFKYWKHLVAALILAGVSIYTYLEYFAVPNTDKKTKKILVYKRPAVVPKNPVTSQAIPSEVPYLIVGAGTAAFSAFRSIKAIDPTAKVLMITDEGDLPYMRPPLSKEIWYNKNENQITKLMFKQWNGAKRSLFYEPREFYMKVNDLHESEKGGVAVATGWKVKKIDATNKIAYLEDDKEIKYGKCLIATGATPKILPLFEQMSNKIKEKIIQFRTKEDFMELVHNVSNPNVKNIVVIGGGFLGSELSTSLVRNLVSDDQTVYQVFKEKHILDQVLPEYLSKWATKRIQNDGVKCLPNVEVHDCRMKNGKLNLILTDGDTLEADQIIVAIGVKANTDLAAESNLEVDSEQGGFLVNAELEARSNLWVAGDAACFYDVKLGRRRIEHHDNAVISGKLAGENMVGAGKPYVHQSMLWSDLGQEVGFEGIGIIDSELETFGVFAKPDPETSDSESTTTVDTTSKLTENKDEVRTEIRSDSQSKKTDSNDRNSEIPPKTETNDFEKGVIFYLRNKVVVGIVLWNIFNRMSVARQVLARDTKSDELDEVVKLFNIHED